MKGAKMGAAQIRDSIIRAGVKNLREFGYPKANMDTILTDAVYKAFFAKMLEDNIESSTNPTITFIMKRLLTEVTES